MKIENLGHRPRILQKISGEKSSQVPQKLCTMANIERGGIDW